MNIDVVSVIICNLDINEYEEVVNTLHDREQNQILSYWKIHTKYEVKENASCKEWFRNGKRHRDGDLPAVEQNDRKEWFKNGLRHRDGDLPAIVWKNGTKLWWQNGLRHRNGDLPAVEHANGRKEWWRNGVRYYPS